MGLQKIPEETPYRELVALECRIIDALLNAVIVAFGVAMVVFVYQDYIEPTHEPATPTPPQAIYHQ